jgi:Tol biopolymer transport system component/DNA-binding winged helix-turn-helix (wHTH) protein
MVGRTPDVFAWDDFRLDLDRYRLERGNAVLTLEPKALDLLALLVSQPGHLFSKQEIFETLWPNTAVTDHALTRVVAQLRRVLQDEARDPRFIETVPTRGYRWKCPVRVETAGTASAAGLPPETATMQVRDPAFSAVAAGHAEPTPHRAPTVSARSVTRQYAVAVSILAVLLVVGGAWLGARLVRLPAAVTADVAAARVPWPVQVTTHTGLDMNPAFSPRGDALAFASDRSGAFEIYVRSLGEGGTETALTTDGGQNLQPSWSPDGTQLAYHSARSGGIWVMPARGGVARQVASEGSRPAWSPDGRRIAYQSDEHADVTPSAFGAGAGSTIWVVNPDGSGARPVTNSARPMGGHASPAWTPDGRYLGFTVFEGGRANGAWLVATDTGQVTRLPSSGAKVYELAFAPDGRAVYMAGGEAIIYKLPFDPQNGVSRGPIEPIAVPGVPGVRGLSVSGDGARLGFAGLALNSQIWSQPIRADGSPRAAAVPLTEDTSRRTSMAVVSPDGTRVAYMSSRRGDPPNVWVMDIDGGHKMQVTSSDAAEGKPMWFPDGERLAYFSDRGETNGLWSLAVSTRRETLLLDVAAQARRAFATASPAEMETAPSMTRAIFSVVGEPDGRRRLYTTPLSRFSPQPVAGFTESVGYPAWSPDERLVAVEIKDGSSMQAGVVDLSSGALKWLTKERGQMWVRSWSPDGRKIAAAALRDGLWSLRWIDAQSGAQGEIAPPSPPNVYVRYPGWSPRNDVVVFERGELHGNIWMVPLR